MTSRDILEKYGIWHQSPELNDRSIGIAWAKQIQPGYRIEYAFMTINQGFVVGTGTVTKCNFVEETETTRFKDSGFVVRPDDGSRPIGINIQSVSKILYVPAMELAK